MKTVFMIMSFFASLALANTPELSASTDSSQWMEIKSHDGKVITFIHQSSLKKKENEPVSFLSIYQMAKDSTTNSLLTKIKKSSKVDPDLTPEECYSTDSQEPGTLQTWCETKKSYYVVVVEGGLIKMKENERTKNILAQLIENNEAR